MSLRAPFGLPWPIAAGAALFLAITVAIVVSAMVPRDVATFAVTPADSRRAPHESVDTVTLDGRAEGQWRFFDFTAGVQLVPPDTAGWDVAVQRFRIITARAVADVGPVPIDSVAAAPDARYVPTTWGRDTVNTALERWYRYGFLTHLLRSKQHVYVIHDAGGGWATFRLLSYYCPGPEGGCITIEYGYRGSGAAVGAGVAEPR